MVWAAVLLGGTGVAVAAETLSFGVVPQQSAQTLARHWGPLCAHLSQSSGIEIRFATAPDIPRFEQRLAQGRYDLAYMNPYHYTVFCRNPGYRALAKQRGKRLAGIVVVSKDSPYRNFQDLAGQILVFPSPAAFGATILTRAYFQKAGIPITPKYVKSHDSVYLNVANGFFAAGGGVIRTFLKTDPSVREKLTILLKTASFSPHAIASHPRVSDALRQRLLAALMQMNDNPKAETLLDGIGFHGFAEAFDEDWDDVRALQIDSVKLPIGTPPASPSPSTP